jgi:type II secretory pathway pseudopilin PulG
MIVVAIVGILAAIAIPTMARYIKRSKATEPLMNLRKMYDASAMYFAGERSGATGTIVAKQFPDTQVATPANGTCCVSPGGKCAPNNFYWQTGPWQALHFAVDDPFWYSYEYTSSGSDATATFRADAHGDLDCNTVYSTYERSGSVDARLNVVGAAGLFIDKDTE